MSVGRGVSRKRENVGSTGRKREASYLTEDGVEDVHVRGEIDPGWAVISELLVGLPLIVEDVQLHPHVRRVALPAKNNRMLSQSEDISSP